MRDGYRVLDDDHRVVEADLHTWAQFLDEHGKRTVGKDTVDGVTVSTVFLGSDHSYGPELGQPDPLWFETMVFEGVGKGWDQTRDRYTTWEQAEAGHKEVVARLRAGASPWEDSA